MVSSLVNELKAFFTKPAKLEVKILDGVTIDVQSNKIVAFVG